MEPRTLSSRRGMLAAAAVALTGALWSSAALATFDQHHAAWTALLK